MSRPRKDASTESDRTPEAFKQHLWRAVEAGSVTAMKLWADLHRAEFQGGADDAGGLFTPSPLGDTSKP